MDTARRALLVAVVGGGLLYLAWRNGTLDALDLIDVAVLVPSVILHEVSHGWVALAFGDDTAKRAGRLTLNPLSHIDPMWTVIVPAVLALTGAPVIGMAKPVPVSPRRMRNPRNQSMFTALAGPAVNVILAVIAGLLYRARGFQADTLDDVIWAFGIINVLLAVFNLLPIPPLDGSSVLERVLPQRWLVPYLEFRKYSFIVLLLLFFLAGDLFGIVFDPFVGVWRELATS